jgi:Na+/H+ antiporter NhaC
MNGEWSPKLALVLALSKPRFGLQMWSGGNQAMAKSRSKRANQEEMLRKRRILLQRSLWGVIIILCLFFGYTYGYPLVAEGQVVKGIATGLAYGGGAFLALAISIFLNRKLKGM